MRSLPFVAVIAGAVAIAMSSAGASAPSATPSPKSTAATPKPSKNAPGDEYFGRFKWSVLQVRYEIQFLKKQVGYHTVAPEDAMHQSRIIEDTLFAWAQAYPRDSWLPQTSFGLVQLLMVIPLPEAHERAIHLLQRIATRYAKTPYGHNSKLALDNGIPQAEAYELVTPVPSAAAATPASDIDASGASPAVPAPAASGVVPAPAVSGVVPSPGASSVLRAPSAAATGATATPKMPEASPLSTMTPPVKPSTQSVQSSR